MAAQSDLLRVRPASGRALRVAAAEVVIRLEDGLDRQVRWVSGSAPGPATTTRDVRTVGGDLHRVRVTPVALLDDTARAWGVSAGDVLDLQISPFGRIGVTPTAVVLAGTFEPVDPTAEVWAAEPRMLGV
ncbi:MAG: hypothetical protein LCH57_11735, partial [Proteobacteria bacterium]|nr:hypothetical protein [Pseudomonadota bacterium]